MKFKSNFTVISGLLCGLLSIAMFQNCANRIPPTAYSAPSVINDLTSKLPQISNAPLSLSRNVGQPLSIAIIASGPDLTYKWSKAGVALTQFTTSSLFISSAQLSDAGQYTVEAKNSFGSSSTVISLAVIDSTVTIPPLPAVTAFSPSSVPVVITNSSAGLPVRVSPTLVAFSVTADSTIPLSYEWFYINSQGTSAKITGATAPTLPLDFSTYQVNAGRYRVVVTNSSGSVYTEGVVSLTTEQEPPPPPVDAPTISSFSPASASVVVNYYDGEITTVNPSTVTFAAVAASATAMTYQWYYISSTGAASALAGATGSSLTLDFLTDSIAAGRYRVVVSNSGGSAQAEGLVSITRRFTSSCGTSKTICP